MLQNKLVTIKEQIIHDPASGLTIQFESAPDGTPRLRVYGQNLEFGNRDFAFDGSGDLVGRGTALAGPNRPTIRVNLDQL